LTGLVPNTRYYYRVTSADAAGNTTTSPATGSAPASWTPTVAPVVLTTAADFAAGSGAYIGVTGDGEVLAAPAIGEEFSGSLSGQWRTSVLQTGGSVTVGSGGARISGSRLYTNGTWTSGRSVAGVATLAAGQSVGWGSIATASSTVRAAFVVTAQGGLTASVVDGTRTSTTAVTGSFTGAPHEYRVDWSSNGTATFFVDGTQVASSAFTPSVQLRVLAVDPTQDATPLTVDWLRLAPYATSSTYTSAVVDASAVVAWDTLTADTTPAAGSAVTLRVRSGPTATPGTSWTGWTTVPAGGAITRSARYLQFSIVVTTSGSRFASASVSRVGVAYHVI
jgi:hypothetical protein